MSEEILKVFLDDLQTIRVVCQHCGVVVETDMKTIRTAIRLNECPVCQQSFTRHGSAQPGYYPLHELAKIFAHLDAIKADIKIEFPIKISKPTP